eukprot:jgi/Galph1/5231/GphlegSOOS_G3859.1
MSSLLGFQLLNYGILNNRVSPVELKKAHLCSCFYTSKHLFQERVSLKNKFEPVHRSISVSRRTGFVSRDVCKAATKGVDFGELDGTSLRVGIVYSRWNSNIVQSLLQACKKTLTMLKVDASNIVEFEVPGSFELPLAARYMTFSQRVDCVICIGCLIKGETSHYEMIANAVTNGLMDIGIASNIPVIYGVLTCLTEEQAIARSTGENNHGIGWAKTAVEMGNLKLSQFGQTTRERAIKF